ncbi:hypothetical protein [Allorhizocola rhizosphaerae]|uniref:hypothetical protein n=1 Tax=Allorhizocola rhizosphaerae TaxID=1872709 RepID=UPI000E3EB2B4|nr:hypothetical protein [Allorhizocola rhizosphaerae]
MTPLGKATSAVIALTLIILVFANRAGFTGLPLPPFMRQAEQITIDARGGPPWTVEGHGWRYTVESVVRTTSEWQFKRRPSITVTAYVTRTVASDFSRMEYLLSDHATGAALDGVPFQGGGNGDPPLNQRSKLVHVVWDTDPPAKRLTITLHDFHWPDGQDLILRDVPVWSNPA